MSELNKAVEDRLAAVETNAASALSQLSGKATIEVNATEPAESPDGKFWLDTVTPALKVAWQDVWYQIAELSI